MWSGMTTASESSQPELEMEFSPMRPSSAISTHSTVTGTPQAIRAWLMSLPEDFPASHSALQASAREPQTSATDGPLQSSAFVSFDRDGRYWKTFQGCLLADISIPSLVTWPKAGSMSDGVCYRLLKWERRISVIGSGLLPTPTDVSKGGGSSRSGNRIGETPTLQGMARKGQWPTPKAYSYNESHRPGITALDIKVRGMYQDNPQYWPTPRVSANENRQTKPTPSQMAGKHGMNLATAVNLPTPAARDYRSPNKNGNMADQLPNVVGGQLNPTWVEWLMGWPLGWTELKPLAMDKFRQWLEQHGC